MTEEPTEYVVLVQIGFQRGAGKKPGQLVKAFHQFKTGGETEITRGTTEEEGKWLTDLSDRLVRQWYMAKVRMSEGDSIRYEIFTGYAGRGEDQNLTQKRMYIVDSSAPIRTFELPQVGFNRYPILKGRLLEVESVTKREETDREIEGFIDDESGM
jgi:hypothetical protein